MRRLVLPGVGALLAACPAVAGAHELSASVAFSPDRAGAPSGISATFTARGVDRPPDAVAIFTPAGLRIDPRAVRVRCSDDAARRQECPSASRVGSGEVRVQTVVGPFSMAGSAFLGVARKGERAALWLMLDGLSRALRASVQRSGGGYVVLLDDLASQGPQVPRGAISEISGTLRMDRRSRTLTRTRTVRGRKRKVRTTYHLLRNPTTCPASGWAGRVEMTYGADVRQVAISAPCS